MANNNKQQIVVQSKQELFLGPLPPPEQTEQHRSPFDVPGVDCGITLDEILDVIHANREGRP